MTDINASFLFSLVIIALGFVAKTTGLVKESDGQGIARIIFNFTLPAVVITSFSGMKTDLSLVLMPVFAVAFSLLMTGLSLLLFRKRERRERGLAVMLMAGFNIGLFAYPLVEMIWGNAGLRSFGMFDMGNAFIVFSQEKADMRYGRIAFRMFSSIPFLAYIVTLAFVIAGISFPKPLLDVTGIIGRANMPLSLLLLGILLSFDFKRDQWLEMLSLFLLRYGIGLALGALVFFLLPMDLMARITLLAGFCLPTSMAVIPYSVEFGYDSRFMGTFASMTIVASFALVWLISLVFGSPV
jgi:predicted permease